MALDLSLAGASEDPTAVLLLWPPDAVSMFHQVIGYIIMRREGGILLAVPGNVLEDESLVQASTPLSEGVPALVGPYAHFTTQVMVTGGTGQLEIGPDPIEVLVLDLKLPEAQSVLSKLPEDAADIDVLNLFMDLDFLAKPVFEDLSLQVNLWLSNEIGPRPDFYTAEEAEHAEEETPKTTSKPKATQRSPGGSMPPDPKAPGGQKPVKRPTVATISQQMEAVLTALPVITDQLAKLTQRQDDLERGRASSSNTPAEPKFRPIKATVASTPVSGMLQGATASQVPQLAGMLGPPPVRAKQPATRLAETLDGEPLKEEDLAFLADPRRDLEAPDMGSPMARALLEQSRALSALVAHFHTAGSDPFTDLSSSTPTTGVKGTAAREKLQRELAQGSGAFFLKVSQSIARRMNPTGRLPSDLSSLGDTSLLAYLERYGGYGQNRELGMVQWALGHAYDAAAKEEWGLVRDHLALTAVMVEQAALDNNRWGLAWLLRLLDDPPQNLWINRGQTATGSKRPFAPLCSQAWTTTALAYMKEAEILQGKRSELLGGGGKNPSTEEGPGAQAKPHPKRKPGKGKQGAQAQTSSPATNVEA